MSKNGNGTLHVVFCDNEKAMAPHLPMFAKPPPFVARVASIEHGDNMKGTNPVAVVHGRLCRRKPGCAWCTGLRDRIRSRTIR
jgi:hypothetical protein